MSIILLLDRDHTLNNYQGQILAIANEEISVQESIILNSFICKLGWERQKLSML